MLIRLKFNELQARYVAWDLVRVHDDRGIWQWWHCLL